MKERQKAVEVRRVRIEKGRRLVKIGEIWYLETCKNGIQRRRTLSTSHLNDAMELQKSLESADDELPQQISPGPSEPLPEVTLASALKDYLEWYERVNRASSFSRTKPLVASFVGALGEKRDPKEIKREDVQKWITSRSATCAPHTVQSDFQRVRAFLYWVADMKGAADRSICRRIDLPRPKKGAKSAPSPEKIRAVVRALGNQWIGDYFRVLIETGMRPSELLGIRGADLRDAKDDKGRASKSLRIAPAEDRDLKTEASERVILLSETAAEILARRKDAMLVKSAPIFPNDVGEVFKENSVYHLFKDALAGEKNGKVPAELDMTLYDARHYFCSEHAAPGPNHMGIDDLATYIGHSAASTGTLRKYYIDQKALLRGAPSSLIEQKDGEVLEMKKQAK